MGDVLMEYTTPAMLSTNPPANTTVRTTRVKPCDLPRAVAQTASRTQDTTKHPPTP